jgi:hypothetical protein
VLGLRIGGYAGIRAYILGHDVLFALAQHKTMALLSIQLAGVWIRTANADQYEIMAMNSLGRS